MAKKRRLVSSKLNATEKTAHQIPRWIFTNAVELPVEIICEILAYVEPLDLLRLAQTTKPLRSFLMTKSSKPIWAKAFKSMDVPACPDDISEPEYAYLLYGDYCQLCLSSQSLKECLNIRVKACIDCLRNRKHFILRSSWLKTCKYGKELAARMPHVEIDRQPKSCGRSHGLRPSRGCTDLVYLHLDTKWRREYFQKRSRSDRAEWLKNTLAERQNINEHVVAVQRWRIDDYNKKQKLASDAYNQRKTVVESHIRDAITRLGWDEEVALMPVHWHPLNHSNPHPLHQDWVKQATFREPTPRVLRKLETKLDTYMTAIQEARIHSRETLFLSKVHWGLTKVVQLEVGSSKAVLPPIGHFFNLSQVRELVRDAPRDVEPAGGIFDFIKPQISSVVEEWRISVRDEAFEILKKSLPYTAAKYECDRDQLLSLATSCFSCDSCDILLPFDDTFGHECFRKGCLSKRLIHSTPPISVGEVGLELWNESDHLVFEPRDVKLVKWILESCGLDPKVTTATELDERDPVVHCLECMSTGDPRVRWRFIKQHITELHNGRHTLTVPDDPDQWVQRMRK